MVIIIGLSFGERREDEKNGDCFAFVSTASSLVCRARASRALQAEALPYIERRSSDSESRENHIH